MSTRVPFQQIRGDRPLQLPGARRPDRRGWITALITGALLGGGTLVIPALLDDDAAFGFLAVLLGAIAGVYLGFALADGRVRALGTEYVGMAATAALATLGLVVTSPLLLAVGYLGHGLWDAIHRPKGLDTVIPWWYVPLCIGYDAVVGLYILVRFA
jgi:hypothetical protein